VKKSHQHTHIRHHNTCHHHHNLQQWHLKLEEEVQELAQSPSFQFTIQIDSFGFKNFMFN
jgi:hypothetical protein